MGSGRPAGDCPRRPNSHGIRLERLGWNAKTGPWTIAAVSANGEWKVFMARQVISSALIAELIDSIS